MPFLCNIFEAIGRFYIKCRRKAIRKTFYEYLTHEKPDLVISVVPLVNFYILQAAQALNLPFLIIPSDIDVSPYITGFSSFL